MPSVLGERLAELRKKHKLSGQRLAEKIGVTQAYISHIENAETPSPKIDLITKIAQIFGVSVAYLLGEINTPALAATQKRDDGMDLSAILPTDNLVWISVIRPEITLEAGYGADYTHSQLEWETVEHIPLFDGELSAFYSEKSLLAVRVEGDSMEPQIYDGDIVVFAKTQEWISGNIMAVCLDGKLLVKGIISNGANKPPTLRSTNKAYDDIKISPDSYFAIIGRVVRIIRVSKPKPVI